MAGNGRRAGDGEPARGAGSGSAGCPRPIPPTARSSPPRFAGRPIGPRRSRRRPARPSPEGNGFSRPVDGRAFDRCGPHPNPDGIHSKTREVQPTRPRPKRREASRRASARFDTAWGATHSIASPTGCCLSARALWTTLSAPGRDVRSSRTDEWENRRSRSPNWRSFDAQTTPGAARDERDRLRGVRHRYGNASPTAPAVTPTGRASVDADTRDRRPDELQVRPGRRDQGWPAALR